MIEQSSSPPTEAKGKIVSDRLVKVFEVFNYYDLDARLVGSLGRYAAVGLNPPSLASIGSKRGIKDIDVMILSPDRGRVRHALEKATIAAYPCVLDERFARTVDFSEQDIRLKYEDLTLPVNAVVFERRIGKTLGVIVPTFNPRTLAHLTEFLGVNPKFFASLHAYLRLIRYRDDLLPEHIFAPFHKMYDLQRKAYPVEAKIRMVRYFYHTHVSEEIRDRIVPIMRPIRHLLEKIL